MRRFSPPYLRFSPESAVQFLLFSNKLISKRKGFLEPCKRVKFRLWDFPPKKALLGKGKIMKTVVLNHGFNRIEHRQIINLERAKLKPSFRWRTTAFWNFYSFRENKNSNQTADFRKRQAVWNSVANHRLVRKHRRRIDCLTDAYPPVLRQGWNRPRPPSGKIFASLNAVRYAAQNSVWQNLIARLRFVVKLNRMKP